MKRLALERVVQGSHTIDTEESQKFLLKYMRLQKSLIAFQLSTLYLVPPITMKVTRIGSTKEELDDRNAEAFSSAILIGHD